MKECFDINECFDRSHNCHTEASCSNFVGGFACTCNYGFEGDGLNCVDIDECTQQNECSENAECSNTIGSYTCECNQGFQGNGKICDNIDECALEIDACVENAECFDTSGSYNCACIEGYEGNGFEQCLRPKGFNECLEGPG